MTTDLTQYEPYQRLSHMMRSMDQLMEPLFRGASWMNGDGYEGTLPVDISETEGEIIVRASLPGYQRDDIDVQLHHGVLTIKANLSWPEEMSNERFHRRERVLGPVSRRVALPGLLYESEVQADLKDGVLTLRVPIPEQARPKRIQINGA